MAGLPPWLAAKQQGNSGGSNAQPSGSGGGQVPPQFARGKNKKSNPQGRQDAIARRMAAVSKK